MRRGPNVVGPFGLLQTIADALKFLFKEVIVPAGANKVIFFLAPLVSVLVAFIAWAVIPFNNGWVSPTSMSASCIFSRCRHWASMAR